jgi:FHS family Na+ dependent glucose MFS transporter 1
MSAEDVSDSDVMHQVELIGDHTMIEDKEASSVERNGFIQTREESEDYEQESEEIEYEQGKEGIGDNTNKKSNFCTNLIKTILFCYAFIMLGIAIGSLGPSLLRLAENTNSSMKKMGVVFTLRGIGYVSTALIIGYVLDRYSFYSESRTNLHNKALVYCLKRMEKGIVFLGVLLLSFGILAMPFVRKFSLLVLCNFIVGVGSGCVDIVSNILLVWIWKDAVNPYMQALHFCFGVGALICPIYFQQIDNLLRNSRFDTFNFSFVSLSIFMLSAAPPFLFVSFENTSDTLAKHDEKTARKIPMELQEADDSLIDEFGAQSSSVLDNDAHIEPTIQSNKSIVNWLKSALTKLGNLVRLIDPKQFIVCILTGLSLLFYVGAEVGYGGLIYSYVLTQTNQFSENAASILTSTFWISFTLGRAISIPISKFLSVRNMLLIDIFFTVLSIGVLVIIDNKIVIWIATVVIGLAMASQYPSTVSLPTGHLNMNLTGIMASLMVICGALGEMLIPMIMTAYLKHLMIILLTVISVASMLYIVLLFFIPKEENDQTLSEVQ